MLRLTILLLVAAAFAGCRPNAGSVSPRPFDMTFLRSETCPRSDAMYRDLLAALRARAIAEEPDVIDTAHLSNDDPRTGYGVPTILVDGHDLFGAERPRPQAPT